MDRVKGKSCIVTGAALGIGRACAERLAEEGGAIALFDLHNRVRDAGVPLLYAARDVPAALPQVLPDLRSRLSQCTLVALRTLDDEGRAQVLRQRAASRGLAFDDAALEWLLRRCSRDLSDLASVFEQLDRASLAAQRRLTVPFLRQVLETAP